MLSYTDTIDYGVGLLDLLKENQLGIKRGRGTWFGRIASIFDRDAFGAEVWDELEEVLVSADVGVETTANLLGKARQRVKTDRLSAVSQVRDALKEEMIRLLSVPPPTLLSQPGTTCGHDQPFVCNHPEPLAPRHSERTEESTPAQGKLSEESYAAQDSPRKAEQTPEVILVVGVNGSGKTTSIAKLAYAFTSQGRRIILAAADTFRAAAIEQLEYWGGEVGAEVIAHQPGGDPGAVAYDAVQAGHSRRAQAVIIDTAGRLHTKFNLMEELKKIKRVVAKLDASAPHQVLLVMDATAGQNGLAQARYFADAVDVTGVFLAKLDGTARGGIVFAICDQLNIPISYIGTGEKLQDMTPFDARVFVEAIL